MTTKVRSARPVHVEKDAKATPIPSGLLLTGLALYVAGAFAHVGASGVVTTLVGGLIIAAVQTVLLIVAAFLVATLLSISFGEVGSAIFKFAAISIFCGGLATLLPAIGLLSLLVFLGLLIWLFELDLVYAVALTIAYWLVGFAAAVMLRSAM